MTGSVGAMIDAAKLAREATVKEGAIERDVEIIVTELGFVVRGMVKIGPSWAHQSQQLDWAEFLTNPALLANSVRLVEQALIGREAHEAAEDRAGG